MGFNDYFSITPLVAWNFDSVQVIYDLLKGDSDFVDLKKDLTKRIDNSIRPVLFDMGMKFNLGGEQEKEKLVTTDKPIGIFDFSLASNGLYRVPEYYSIELERDYPDKFQNLGLHAGIIPPNLVQSRVINGVRNFYYSDGEKEYSVTQRQKGATALAQGDPNAKLKFATKNKKVYLKFRRNGGKVKYCEIYTLYYYTSMGSKWQYNMRHLPVLLLAEYFEQTGIKTRLYPTRFANPRKYLNWPSDYREYDLKTGAKLPQYEIAIGNTYDTLIVAPLMVKDFGQEIDYFDFFAISDERTTIYDAMANLAYDQEFRGSYKPYGRPDQSQLLYLAGFERYKNKYAEYVKRGLWKSKEVQPEAQLFFHSISIKRQFYVFWSNMWSLFNEIPEFENFVKTERQRLGRDADYEPIILSYSPIVREFFEWWMKLCALRLKTKMAIINSKMPRKAMKEAAAEVEAYADSIENFLSVTSQKLDEQLTNEKDLQKRYDLEVLKRVIANMIETRTAILIDEDMLAQGKAKSQIKVNAKLFLTSIINETTVFIEEDFFPTPKEDVENRMSYADYLIEELEYL